MGLFNSKEFSDEVKGFFHRPTDHCFYCFEPLGDDVWIFWDGCGAQIWMHPACAKRLADALNKDWHQYHLKHPGKV
jgi:hypothetical protein